MKRRVKVVAEQIQEILDALSRNFGFGKLELERLLGDSGGRGILGKSTVISNFVLKVLLREQCRERYVSWVPRFRNSYIPKWFPTPTINTNWRLIR